MMKMSHLAFGTMMLLAIPGAPAVAQDSASSADQTLATDDAPPQPTDKEAKELDRCKRMTAQQRAQSSKCTDLMTKFGIGEKKGNGLMQQQALGH